MTQIQTLLTALLCDPPDPDILTDPVCWSSIKAHAADSGLAQIVAFHSRPHVTAAERLWCDRVLLASWRKHDKNLGNLDFLLGILHEEGIEALALKGPMLALRHYAPPFLRKPSSDLDIGIKDADLERAVQVLVRAGYETKIPVWQAKARSHSVALTHSTRPEVDVHFRLANGPYGIPIDDFFGRARTEILLGGRSVLVLDPADEILQLVLHGGCGLATLFHSWEIRKVWESATREVRAEALRRAVGYHCAGVFAASHVASQMLWGIPLLTPDLPELKTWLRPRINQKLLANYAFVQEKLATRVREPGIGFLLWKRWLDVQITDTFADAFLMALLLGKSAIVRAIGSLSRGRVPLTPLVRQN